MNMSDASEISRRNFGKQDMTRPMFEAHEQRIAALEAKAAKGDLGNLEFRDFAYFTSTGDGPFCRQCFEVNGKQIRLVDPQTGETGAWICTVCRTFSRDEAARKRRQNRDPISLRW